MIGDWCLEPFMMNEEGEGENITLTHGESEREV